MKIDSSSVVCITGGGDGIGLALGRVFLGQGARVALVDIRPVDLSKLNLSEDDLGRVSAHVLDVANRQQVPEVLQQVLGQHGNRVSVLVNCAGVFGGSGIDKMAYEDFDRVLNINLNGTVTMCREFFPVLRREKEAYIVNLSSMDGLVAMPGALSYVTSKFAVTGFTKALEMDLAIIAPHVHVASVHPGFVSTNIIQNNAEHIDVKTFNTPKGFELTPALVDQFQKRIASTSPAQAAQQIASAMYWNQSRIIVGSDVWIIDWLSRLFPTALSHKLVFPVVLTLVLVAVRLVGKWQLYAALVWYWVKHL